MTDHEHTPTTARIKDDYRRSRVWESGIWESGNGSEAYEKEFDRWFDAEITAAEQRGAARAFKESANEIRREMRWQYEQNINRNSDTGDSIDRLLELEKVFKYRADQIECDDE